MGAGGYGLESGASVAAQLCCAGVAHAARSIPPTTGLGQFGRQRLVAFAPEVPCAAGAAMELSCQKQAVHAQVVWAC